MPLQAGLLGTGGGLPQDDAAIVAATSQLLLVRAPRHPADRGWLPMAHPQAGARAHVPHLHLLLIAASSQQLSIGTPLDAEEGGVEVVRVAQGLHQSTCDRVPHLEAAIFTPTEQAATVGQESEIMHHGSMPVERCAITSPFDVPEPDRLVTAATGQQAPIRAPGHCIHRGCMSRKRLTYL